MELCGICKLSCPLLPVCLGFFSLLLWISSQFHSAICNQSDANLLPQLLPEKLFFYLKALGKRKGINGTLAEMTAR